MTDPLKPAGSTPPAQQASKGQVVQIVSLPEGLRNVSRAMKLDAEVVAQNKDGSTRVRTSEGEIDISIRGRQPQTGEKLVVELPPGSPPKTATVRPAPSPPQTPPSLPDELPAPSIPVPTRPAAGQPPVQSTPTQQPQQPNTQSGNPAPAPSGSSPAPASPPPAKPLPTSYQPPAQGTTPQQTAPLPLQPGQIVRVTTLPPAQAQMMIQQSGLAPESIIASQVSRAAFQSDVIAKTAQGDMQKSLLQTLRPPVVAATAMTMDTGTIFSGTPASLSSGTMPAQLPSQGLPGTSAFSPLAALAQDGTADISLIQNLMAALTGAAGTTAEEGSLRPGSIPPRLFQFDVRIAQILPPQPQLVSTPGSDLPSLSPLLTKQPTDAAFLPDGKNTPLTSGTTRPHVISAIVTGFTPQNLPLIAIRWPGGTLSPNFVLQFAAAGLEVGSEIILHPQSRIAMPSTIPGVPASTNPVWPLMEASILWPAMDDLYQSLAQMSPQAAQSLARIVPSPAAPNQLGAAALLFVAVLRAGDINGWLGDRKIDSIVKSGKSNVMSRLLQDMTNAGRSNADSGPADWKSYPLPMLWQNEISKVMLHLKSERDPQDKENKDGSTRFILDLSLSRMGEVQLDGMLRGKRLDMIVRTELPVSYTMQEAMKKAYADALEGTDIFGELGFQGDMKQWMRVTKREEKLIASA